jgi:hypothetical protein
VSSEKLSFLARFEEKWKFEEIGIFLRKNILQESRWIEKVIFCVFWIFGFLMLSCWGPDREISGCR